ncbi:BON domain-containing protein [Sinorhizobium medicae]|uniref:BON domain-containing protein n=1 Tax=Sinorhizobium medicae TaxID=110321 RepID=UPI000FD90640|nr:BON domain-containing protein [Sinorhizobium medicae]MDX0439905.1 BON domain-containing protein [Sinorhizobium medicae]MDX0490378.1 BON domain-containing protein [Sinorhizobium medicae]MDX0539318.1 BON domain-containing protein [Sinorhizobium medicae]MDX0871760.1 BON domain-containing protein [Sinorhizobium medicae]MDX0952060.1 BON domain-containing protein [Sinorhizobium medicae]
MPRQPDYGRYDPYTRRDWARRDWDTERSRDPYHGSERNRGRGRSRFGEEVEPRGADYENSMSWPTGSYRGESERWSDDDDDRRGRERYFRDYHGPGYGYRGEGRYRGYGGYGETRDYRRGDRDFLDRASDEVASWFGDEDAERRREMDRHRGKGPKGYRRTDSRIQEDVSDRLSDDGALDASNIEVSVTNGEVQLNGTVSSKWAKRRAEDCAENVSGVTNVQNNLRIEPADTSTVQQNPNLTDLS